MTVGAFFQRHTIKAVTGDSRAVDFAVRTKRYTIKSSSCYRRSVDSFGSHSAVFSNCKARTAERRISFANHGIAAHGQPRAGIRAADGYAVDTCNACQSTVHIDIGNIYQTAEQIAMVGISSAIAIFIAILMSEGYLILCRGTAVIT